jgi:hypothetical protein
MMTYKLTPEVCKALGMTPAALNSWLSRHEKYKPKARTPNGAMLWTDAEIEQVLRARATPLPHATWRKWE